MTAQVTAGPRMVVGADAVRREREAKEKWPYVWTVAPPGSEHVFKVGVLASPADDNAAEILAYQVPNNQRFIFRGLVLNFNNNVWVPGDGNVTFSITINKPVGSAAAQGIPYKDFGLVTIPLGSFQLGPWPIEPGELSTLESRSILRASVAINSLIIPPGAPNFFTAIFVGWNIPE